MAWGYHLMLDCEGGHKVNDKEHMRNFIKELVPAIDMIAFGEPWIEHFATHAADKAGLSFCQMIETSNIAGHFVDSTGDFYIDVFSCKPFEAQIVENLVEKYFDPVNIKRLYLTRDARS